MTKVLVVEDDKTLNQAYELILKKSGYDVETVYNGQEALDKADEYNPDLILLDLLMPEMSGLEFLRHYELKTKHPDVRVIVFSNMENASEVEEAHRLGAYKYIVKAWSSPQSLNRVIKEALASRSKSTKA